MVPLFLHLPIVGPNSFLFPEPCPARGTHPVTVTGYWLCQFCCGAVSHSKCREFGGYWTFQLQPKKRQWWEEWVDSSFWPWKGSVCVNLDRSQRKRICCFHPSQCWTLIHSTNWPRDPKTSADMGRGEKTPRKDFKPEMRWSRQRCARALPPYDAWYSITPCLVFCKWSVYRNETARHLGCISCFQTEPACWSSASPVV